MELLSLPDAVHAGPFGWGRGGEGDGIHDEVGACTLLICMASFLRFT
jgi:hypothetical protein